MDLFDLFDILFDIFDITEFISDINKIRKKKRSEETIPETGSGYDIKKERPSEEKGTEETNAGGYS